MTERTTDDSSGPSKRRAVVRTLLILILVLGLALAFALTMTRRLISTWHPEPPATTAAP